MANKYAQRDKDSNYDKKVQKQPARRMGQGSFANLPDKIMVKEFAGCKYRDGITNSFTDSIEDISGISENQR